MMNKEERRKSAKKILSLGVVLGMIIGTLLGVGMLGPELYQERAKSEAAMELLMFTVGVSSYCAEINNMTHQEVLDGYVIKMTHELVGDAVYTEGEKDD